MENDIKLYLALSLAAHLSVFAVSGALSKRSTYIVVPIDLMLHGPARPAARKAEQAVPDKIENLVKKQEKAEEIPVAEKKKADEKKKAAEEVSDKKAEDSAKGAPGGDGYSGPVSFDISNFPFTYYTNQIVRKIGRFWQWSREFGRLKTVVYFKILRDGQVAKIDVKDSSGDSLFDAQAVRAVTLSTPFPPLPESYPGEDLGVYFEFTYRE
ncbi:MAG: cell envelope integrity protein TolA [Endomicrobiales bacterium]|nr:cell envelope integrity protein TolA [Endomicrobiales bacterium]